MKRETLTCAEVQRFLHPFMDGEFEGREEMEVEQHLRECESCRNEMLLYQTCKREMRQHHMAASASQELKSRIRLDLQQAEGGPRTSWGVTLSAAAMLCLVLGGLTQGFLGRRSDTSPSLEALRVHKVLQGNTASSSLRFLNNRRYQSLTKRFHSGLGASSNTVEDRVVGAGLAGNERLPLLAPALRRAQFSKKSVHPLLPQRTPRVRDIASSPFCSDVVVTGVHAATNSSRSITPTVFTATCDENH